MVRFLAFGANACMQYLSSLCFLFVQQANIWSLPWRTRCSDTKLPHGMSLDAPWNIFSSLANPFFAFTEIWTALKYLFCDAPKAVKCVCGEVGVVLQGSGPSAQQHRAGHGLCEAGRDGGPGGCGERQDPCSCPSQRAPPLDRRPWSREGVCIVTPG